MSRILVVYGSTYGQTERVAQRIAEVLRGGHHTVDVHKGDRLPEGLRLGAYDGFVVAASVLQGHHQKYILELVRRHAARLNAVPSAFVSVCGAAGNDLATARGYVDALLRDTGWHPTAVRSFTGAVAYTKYGWVTRWVMRRISRSKGLPTDTSRDWDFTEWNQVERFAEELAVTLAPQSPTPVTMAS